MTKLIIKVRVTGYILGLAALLGIAMTVIVFPRLHSLLGTSGCLVLCKLPARSGIRPGLVPVNKLTRRSGLLYHRHHAIPLHLPLAPGRGERRSVRAYDLAVGNTLYAEADWRLFRDVSKLRST